MTAKVEAEPFKEKQWCMLGLDKFVGRVKIMDRQLLEMK